MNVMALHHHSKSTCPHDSLLTDTAYPSEPLVTTDANPNHSTLPPSIPGGPALTIRLGDGTVQQVEAGKRLTHGRRAISGVDICVAFDTTGSMNDKVPGLIACIDKMVHVLHDTRLDWRFTVIPFGDLTVPGDTIDDSLPWVGCKSSVSQLLRTLPRNYGGANGGESTLEALDAALSKPSRQGAMRVILVITDEPALTHALQPQTVIDRMVASDVLCNVVSPRIPYFVSMAESTGGTWLAISHQVDLGALVTEWTALGTRIAVRLQRVAELGGSPQGLLSLERGRPR